MKWSELIRMALLNTKARWGRSTLCVLGVMVGCMAVLLTTMAGSGAREAFLAVFDAAPGARRIRVYASSNWSTSVSDPSADEIKVEGDMSEERRKRIEIRLRGRRQQKYWRSRARTAYTPLTLAKLNQISQMPEVQHAIPVNSIPCQLLGRGQVHETELGYPGAMEGAGEVIVFGESLSDTDERGILIHEMEAYDLGFRSDADLRQLIGKSIQVEIDVVADRDQQSTISSLASRIRFFSTKAEQRDFMRLLQVLSEHVELLNLTGSQERLIRKWFPADKAEETHTPKTRQVTDSLVVRGVFWEGAASRNPFEDISGIQASGVRAGPLLMMRLEKARRSDSRFYMATVTVSSTKHLGIVEDRLREMGLSFISARHILDRINGELDTGMNVVYGIAAAVLFLTILGISNTLMLSVLQRTSEFGIMKSLGASNRDVLSLVLIEGMLCGVIGAVLATVASFGVISIVKHYVSKYVVNQYRLGAFELLVQFSPVLIAATITGAAALGALASLLPAWRAARMKPVDAMSHS